MNNDFIAPSILSSDFLHMDEEIRKMEEGKADLIHYDVMDGMFVPEITYGEVLLRQMKKNTSLPLDVHLMIENPKSHIESFTLAGADIITFHLEACKSEEEVFETINLIHEKGVKASISIKPMTEVEKVLPYLPLVDMVLIMTVNPGFGGQSFMMDSLDRITSVRKAIDEMNLSCRLQVDGGINKETISLVKKAGADTFVSGSALFKGDFQKNIEELRRILGA